ncbi:ABC transporter ATP-binding protein [Helicobacter mehlei]|uniref:ABC transporter ATP-binding protein n=1 Tax=Helicobacter mehlei TaxID=2316080 RepID=A0A553V2C7_9HELI|nr:ABC transporter ATP-binding protein [Helicobacter mehlei]TSA86554.1 ABC transporter ATP-binding protein [Helicobacter mehlei]
MKVFLKRFYPYVKGHYKAFVVVLLSSVVVAASTAWGTYLVKPTLDDIFIKKDVHMLTILPFLVIVAYLGKSGGIYLQTYFTNYIGLDIVKKLRNHMLEHLLQMELGFFNRTQKGELIARITNDIALVRASLSNYLAESIREALTIIGLISVVIYQSPKLALVGLVIMPLAAFPLSKIIKKVKRLSKANQESNASMTARLSEIFHSIEVIKTSNGENLELQAFKKENQRFFQISLNGIKYAEISSPLMEFLGSIAIALVIYLGGLEVIKGHISVGAFFSFITALFMLYTPIKRLVRIVSNFQEALVAGDRIYEILERVPAIQDGHQELKEPIERIVFQGVSLTYLPNQFALQNINLDLQKGQIIAFKGKSGSGKSSLVNLILRLYEPTSGQITINNTPLQDLQQKSLRAQIGIVTQKVFIFSGSVAENVAYGLEIDTNRVTKCLEQAQALEFVEHLGGIEGTLEEFGTNLSGGQRQRIAIARALYRDASVLIFDEATSALDHATQEGIKQTIYDLRHNRLILMISHNESSLEIASHIYALEEGELQTS